MIERVSRVKRENEAVYNESRHGLRDITGLSEGSKAEREICIVIEEKHIGRRGGGRWLYRIGVDHRCNKLDGKHGASYRG
jgi:hypothetical protein